MRDLSFVKLDYIEISTLNFALSKYTCRTEKVFETKTRKWKPRINENKIVLESNILIKY